MKTAMLLMLVATVLAAPTLAGAQYLGQENGYTIHQFGEPPTFVDPDYNGGYTIHQFGEPPTFVDPDYNGGYTIHQFGEPPTFINPTFRGPSVPVPSVPVPSVPGFGGYGSDDY